MADAGRQIKGIRLTEVPMYVDALFNAAAGKACALQTTTDASKQQEAGEVNERGCGTRVSEGVRCVCVSV